MTSLVAQMIKCLPTVRETWVRSLGWEDPLEKEMAIHSSTLAWKISWMEVPGKLQSVGSQRVGHDWETSPDLSRWRASQGALVVKNLPANAGDIRDVCLMPVQEYPLEESLATHSSALAWRIHGQRSMAVYSPWGCKNLHMTEAT